MFIKEKINRTGNYRYYITNDKNKSKEENPVLDSSEEIRKFSKLRDDGIISEDEFKEKKKELLDL